MATAWAVAVLAALPACDTDEATPGTPVDRARSPTVAATPVAADRQALLDEERERYGALGALAVVRDEAGEWTGVSGVADVRRARLDGTARFRVGSITKPIVATLVLDAVAAGELLLDDVVSDLLPGILPADPAISVQMLLAHTSGVFAQTNEGRVGDIDRLPDPAMRAEARSLVRRYSDGEPVIASDRLLVALAETHDRYFVPGSGYHYSNINYQLAAMALESVTGTTLAALLDERIAEPLGLEHTTIAPPDTDSPDLRGYVPGRRHGMLVDVTDDLIAFGNGGNGGVVSTGDELLTIMQAIVTGQLLPPPLVDEMTAMTLQSDGTYGLGLMRYDLSCGTFYGHTGRVSGTVSIALADTDGSRGTVIAFNLANDTDPRLPELAGRLLCG
jgi:D-alanyl-D-alanine carboxypeptidase